MSQCALKIRKIDPSQKIKQKECCARFYKVKSLAWTDRTELASWN